jgi:hypothetical protein
MCVRKVKLFFFTVLVSVSLCTRAETLTSWENTELRTVPVNYRTDGFSQYYEEDFVANREYIEHKLIDPFADGGIAVIEWGLDAGSRTTYDSKVEQLFGDGLTAEQWSVMRKGDLRAYHNLKTSIDSGNDPFTVAIGRAHALGMKVFGRREMNKEYGPIDSWEWIGFVGKFNKEHPEYRIADGLSLDYKYKEVRSYKLAMLREIAEKGCDGVLLDFLQPVYFADPEKGRPIMTQFIRDVRQMLDEVGAAQNRKINLMIRVSVYDSYERGLDWKACMKEGLIDSISAFKDWPAADYFDIRMDEFVKYRNKIKSKCKIYGHIWQALGLVDTDPTPKGKKKYSKPKTRGMFYAQALIHNRVGCDGIELGFASPQQWQPYLGELGTPEKIEFADKQYMVDIKPYMPVTFDLAQENNNIRKTVFLRVADNINKAVKSGYNVKADVILTCRSLKEGEEIKLSINDNGPVSMTAETLKQQNVADSFISTKDIENKRAAHSIKDSETTFLNDPNWWKKGKKEIQFPAEWLNLGDNKLDFQYSANSLLHPEKLEIVWIELTLNYAKIEKIK